MQTRDVSGPDEKVEQWMSTQNAAHYYYPSFIYAARGSVDEDTCEDQYNEEQDVAWIRLWGMVISNHIQTGRLETVEAREQQQN